MTPHRLQDLRVAHRMAPRVAQPARLSLLLLLLLVLCAACSAQDTTGTADSSGDAEDAAVGASTSDSSTADATQGGDATTRTPDTGDQGSSESGLSYHRDVAPMLDYHCASCHVAGGIAPMTFDDYASTSALAPMLLASVESGRMPPWPASTACAPIQHARVMPSADIALLRDWIAAGKPQGRAEERVSRPTRPTVELPAQPDVTLDMGVDYAPRPQEDSVDDYRCFVIDPALGQDAFINAFRVLPGNSRQVHHALLYSAPATKRARIAELEAQDARPGYTCFGSPKLGGDERLIAGWVPGTEPVRFAERHGIKVASGSLMVLQMHYNTLNDPEGTDRTRVELYYEKSTSPVELVIVPMLQDEFSIPPGDDDAVATQTGPVLPVALNVHGIVPHMHMLGKSIKVTARRNSEEMCLVDVPHWDFNWQGFYVFDRPVQVPRQYTAHLECRFDNSPENQPYGREPRQVTWGDGTFDEMCLVYFIVQLPSALLDL